MQETNTLLTLPLDLCEAKAAKVMRWLSESEDISKTEFAVARLFETGVLQENAKAFVHLILEERHPADRLTLELPPPEIHSILSEALIHTYRYLLTPQQFLAEFLSFGSSSVTIGEKMLARLTYLLDYQYFTDMLDEWFAICLQNGEAVLPLERVSKFIADVDRSLITHAPIEDISVILAPLFEYEGSQSIPPEKLEIFLEDKGLRYDPNAEARTFEAKDVALLLKEALRDSDLVAPAEEFAPIPEYESFLKELRDVGVVLPPLHVAEPEKLPLPPLEMFIGKKLRQKCLDKIFHENLQEYDRAIAMLNQIEDLPQATLNLHTLLQIHKVSSDSKTALRLMDALRMRFGITTTNTSL